LILIPLFNKNNVHPAALSASPINPKENNKKKDKKKEKRKPLFQVVKPWDVKVFWKKILPHRYRQFY
jgi:hypothetical protein